MILPPQYLAMFDAVCMYVCLTSCLVVGIGAVVLLHVPLTCQVDKVQLAFRDHVLGLWLSVWMRLLTT